MSLRYEKLQPCHLQEVNTFLVENYFTKESVGARLGIKPTSKDVNEWLSEVTKPILEQMVRNTTNPILLHYPSMKFLAVLQL